MRVLLFTIAKYVYIFWHILGPRSYSDFDIVANLTRDTRSLSPHPCPHGHSLQNLDPPPHRPCLSVQEREITIPIFSRSCKTFAFPPCMNARNAKVMELKTRKYSAQLLYMVDSMDYTIFTEYHTWRGLLWFLHHFLRKKLLCSFLNKKIRLLYWVSSFFVCKFCKYLKSFVSISKVL